MTRLCITRQWLTWAGFALCLAVVVAAMGWASITLLRLDQAETASRQRAELEEVTRLALWRMDSALTPLVAQENMRPYFWYGAFYPGERAYASMFDEVRSGEVLLPSPLLTQVSPYVRLHFQLDPEGKLTSPQVPGKKRQAAAMMVCATDEGLEAAAGHFQKLAPLISRNGLDAAVPAEAPASAAPGPRFFHAGQADENLDAQAAMNTKEWVARSQNLAQAALPQKRAGPPPRANDVHEGLMKPLWLADELFLIRRVAVNGKHYFQGCWLDWPKIKSWLLESIGDLLPGAALERMEGETGAEATRRLAALPALLMPGQAPALPVPLLSPLRMSLLAAWGCVLLAAAAVAALLGGAMSLSERRGTFVSAVTHELRTPLTTFRMYTEMLLHGMVKDPEKQRSYLATLSSEAERLGHLVENVLSFARLERGQGGRRWERIPLAEIMERMKGRLASRAAQAGMTLAVEASGEALNAGVLADPAAIEQILFNLVDNACKYAGDAADKRIHLQAAAVDHVLSLRLRDHGPGISALEVRRLFRPFSKSAREAAHSAPGVGLGLALSRRLARSMGGDLKLEATAPEGAAFVLSLPRG